jgi:hypothetical protein
MSVRRSRHPSKRGRSATIIRTPCLHSGQVRSWPAASAWASAGPLSPLKHSSPR